MSRALQPVGPDVLEHLTEALGPGVVAEPEARYLEEPRGRFTGHAAAVIRPRTTEEVAATVRLCAEAQVGIIPYAGGTGLVGGQTLAQGPPPVILSVERLNRIEPPDTTDNVLMAGAGAVLAEVQAAARAAGRLFPLSLASEGSARIGGLLATNAGGINVLRYGNARDLCLGVEAVMADGSMVRGLGRLIKDNMGFDLRHLLIGSEGTLGIITAASLRLFPEPAETATAWLPIASPGAALALLANLRARLGGTISAFELIHRQGLDFLAEVLPGVPRPPDFTEDWRVLVEADDGAGAGLRGRFEAALADALQAGLADDALIAQNAGQRDGFWAVRESIPEANRLIGSVASHDVSLPLSQIVAFVAEAGAALARIDPDLRVNCFGHLGDGNLHYNVFPPRGRDRGDYESVRAAVSETVHELVDCLGGSVAAEHGVGRLKVKALERYGDPGKLAAMHRIKAALDPLGILNPGAVLTPN